MTLTHYQNITKKWSNGGIVFFPEFVEYPEQLEWNYFSKAGYESYARVCTKCGQLTLRAHMVKKPVCFDCKRRTAEDRAYGII